MNSRVVQSKIAFEPRGQFSAEADKVAAGWTPPMRQKIMNMGVGKTGAEQCRSAVRGVASVNVRVTRVADAGL